MAKHLNRPAICGDVNEEERTFFFDMYRKGDINTLILSTVGDTGLNLPDANVGI